MNPSLEARAPPSLASHGPARPIPDRAGRRGSANGGMDSPEAIAQSPDRLALPVTSVLVRARPEAGVQRVANFIRSTIPEVEATVSHEAVTALGTQLRASVGNMAVIAGLIWLTTLLLVASAFAVILRERQREIGLFRAMGATRSDIAALVAGEVVTVCTAGGVIGLAVGLGALTAIDRVVDAGPGIPFDWPAVGPVLGLGLLCLAAAPVTGLLAALAPALRAVTLEPHLAIHDAR